MIEDYLINKNKGTKKYLKYCKQIKIYIDMNFIKEFWEFTKIRKKYWLLPIIIVLIIFGGIIVLTQGTVIAPFIYAIF